MKLKSFRTSAALILTMVMLMVAPEVATAQTFTTLHSFDGADGGLPSTALVQANNGDFYGTTSSGGAHGSGTVFKITPSGALTTLHSFCARTEYGSCTDGEDPNGPLVQAGNGNLYGTTSLGGVAYNKGTFFKIAPSGTLTTLQSFCPSLPCRRQFPDGALLQATNGDFYGTTGGPYYGMVFKIAPTGGLTTLRSFIGTDGAYPNGGLIQATNGDLYGTTADYGANGMGGTVFTITPGGTLTTLYSFCSQSGCTDGDELVAGLVQATDGNFYGTTFQGGANGNGTIFKITPGGTLTTLYSFCPGYPNCTDGGYPIGALIQATDGNFYGTTSGGGANNYGTVFTITPGGTLTTLYSFCSQSGCTDGEDPRAGLIQATDGNFYGTTYAGGNPACGCGTVFRLSVGLGLFVETQPTSGKVGAAVKILGTNLTGATNVTFNGTAAVFTVVSSSLITTTVPTGASTGFVTVTTPSGTLTSNKQFRVTP